MCQEEIVKQYIQDDDFNEMCLAGKDNSHTKHRCVLCGTQCEEFEVGVTQLQFRHFTPQSEEYNHTGSVYYCGDCSHKLIGIIPNIEDIL